MNPGQKQFFDYIMDRTLAGKEEAMKSLLAEGFIKQDDSTFTAEYLREFTPRMLALLQEEHVEEVKKLTAQFGSRV